MRDVFGRDPWRDAVSLHRDIAYVPGDVTLWPSLTGGETIDLLARMRGGQDRGRRNELIERFGPIPPRRHAPTPGQSAEGLADLGSVVACRLLLLDRAEQRPGPVDGERISAKHR